MYGTKLDFNSKIILQVHLDSDQSLTLQSVLPDCMSLLKRSVSDPRLGAILYTQTADRNMSVILAWLCKSNGMHVQARLPLPQAEAVNSLFYTALQSSV